MSNENDQKEIIKRISKIILNDIAPEELILTDTFVDDYFVSNTGKDITKTGIMKNDIPLGFGNIDLVVVVLIPVILTALNKVTESITNSTVNSIKEVIAKKSKKKNVKTKSGTLAEMQIDELEKQLTIKLSSSRLTRKKAEKISGMILALIAAEL